MQDFRKATVQTHLSMLPAEVALRFRVFPESTAGSSTIWPHTSDAVRLADGPTNKTQLRSIKDSVVNLNQNARQKKSDAHLSQYAPKAHLQAAEALLTALKYQI